MITPVATPVALPMNTPSNSWRRVVSILVAAALGASLVQAQTNTLLIVADDVGVDGVSAYKEGAAPPPTPSIDALAKAGILFRNAYANPICSPTHEHTLPEILGQRGLATALIGKWHLGDARNGGDKGPNLAGWSHYAGHMWNLKAPETYFSWRKVTNGSVQTSKVYATTDNVNDAISWIKAQQKPWVCCVCFNAAHAPFHAPPASLHTQNLAGKNPNSHKPLFWKAMVQAIDTEIGRLFTTLGPTVMARTNVIFVGDNGTPGGASQPPFTSAHAKASLYEGGINVPLVISGPAVVSGGREEKALVSTVDLFPTVLQLAGIDARTAVPRSIPLDGISLWPYLQNTAKAPLRKTVYAERFGSAASAAAKDGIAVRNQTYKLIRWLKPAREEFYDLAADAFEAKNLLSGRLSAVEKANYDALAAELSRLGADYFPFGKGCAGTAGVPRLELVFDTLPRVGSTFVTLVAGLSKKAPAAIGCVGLSNKFERALPLPLDLALAGMPGCQLAVSLDHLVPLWVSQGSAVWYLPIPQDTRLLSLTFYQQALVAEPGVNQQNLILSHAARAIVGGK
jgi:arylsulfatase A-like enzyme